MAIRYSSLDDIKGEFKSLQVSANSVITDAKLTGFIEQADEEIDARIGTRYETPVDTSAATKSAYILRTISIALVKERVAEILEIANGSNADQKAKSSVMSVSEARKKLKEIQDGTLLLQDATLLSARDGVADFNTDSDQVGESFQRNVDQW